MSYRSLETPLLGLDTDSMVSSIHNEKKEITVCQKSAAVSPRALSAHYHPDVNQLSRKLQRLASSSSGAKLVE